MKALQRDPSLRYPSAVDMRHDLREAERMLWLQEREAREVVPTTIKDPSATLALPEPQETSMARMAAVPTVAAPTPTQPEAIPLETIKSPPFKPFIPDETPTENPASTARRNLWIAIACVAGLVVIALVAYGLWPSKTQNAGQKTTGASQQQPAVSSVKHGIGIELVLVPAGSFKMGSNSYDDERPVHDVTISMAFYMGKYEVTQAQWQAVMGSNPSNFKGDNLPVENVSWDDAVAFIARLNAQKDGYSYRLPSEAEWEYACRAGTTGDYAGDLDAMAWYDKNSGNKTHDVGTKAPNAFGLFDMHGNVLEWCQDWYQDSYSGAPTDGSAWLSGGDQNYRVLRGGSWNSDAGLLRSTNRSRSSPDVRNADVGFRVVAVR
jgi:formylglycine-generating enzyme required for sulfatase activity